MKIISFSLVPLNQKNNLTYIGNIFNVTNSTLTLTSFTFGFIKFNFRRNKIDFRLNSQSLILSNLNSTVSLLNSSLLNNHFNKTIIDISSFNQIIIENILFKNVFAFFGMKINHGNASKLIMNSIQFININVDNYLVIFDSLDSTFMINDLSFLSFLYTKSKKNNIT